MKKITVFYMASEIVNGIKVEGEACTDIVVSDYVAGNLLKTGNSGCANGIIERILTNSELLKDRTYIPNSISCFMEY